MSLPPKTVAVITSTIGRDELSRAILSVQNQDYPCRHYVFVDGEKYHDKARQILEQFPHVCATYLPMNTGADGWTNSSINAIAPFLVSEDIICYLDDDNFYEPHHVSDVVATFERTDSDLVYTLRNMVDTAGNHICRDKMESIGWKTSSIDVNQGEQVPIHLNFHHMDMPVILNIGLPETLIDTNCFAFKTAIARQVAPAWRLQKANDRAVFQTCKNFHLSHACTGRFSVNYLIQPRVTWGGIYEKLLPYLNSPDDTDKLIYQIMPLFYESNQFELPPDDVAYR